MTFMDPARSPLQLTREQILAYRRHVQALDERLPAGARSLRRAAWAGLQDSMPRAALLSIHARVAGHDRRQLGASVARPALGAALQRVRRRAHATSRCSRSGGCRRRQAGIARRTSPLACTRSRRPR